MNRCLARPREHDGTMNSRNFKRIQRHPATARVVDAVGLVKVKVEPWRVRFRDPAVDMMDVARAALLDLGPSRSPLECFQAGDILGCPKCRRLDLRAVRTIRSDHCWHDWAVLSPSTNPSHFVDHPLQRSYRLDDLGWLRYD